MRQSRSFVLVVLLILSSFTIATPGVQAAFPPPVADAGDDQVVVVDDEVTLDGSASRDLNDDPLTYVWDFDDSNGTEDRDGVGVTVTTSYSESGRYTVTLTVSDGDYEDTDTCTITVLPASPDNQRPIAAILAPLPGVYNVSDPITFRGTGIDPNGDPLTGRWDFGDDTTSTQPETSHTYHDPGPRYITWTVSDGERNDTARTVIMISEQTTPEVNRRPDATFNYTPEEDITVGMWITFDATNSSDPDGDPLTYEWDFNLDDGLQMDASDPVVRWRYNESGDYTVLLQVRDGKTGGWASHREPITVEDIPNDPPNVNAGNDAQVQVGVSLTFRGTASDPDGDIITSYQWDFGDGDMWESDVTGQTNHTYREPGNFVATFTARDERGGSASDTRNIEVLPPPDLPPTAKAGEDMTVMEGDVVYFYGRGTDDYRIAKYEWDFNNDGVWDNVSTTSGDAQWTYSIPSTYTAIFRVTDAPRPGVPGPGQTAEDHLIVTVLPNEPPTARIVVSSLFVQTGEYVQFRSQSEDPEGGRLDYAWDLDGDGRIDSNVANPRWTYTREGNYQVILTVTDDFGQSDSDMVTMQVSQTYSVSIEVDTAAKDMEVGTSHEFRATVSNDGNGNDQFKLSLSGEKSQWATLSRVVVNLNATEKRTVTVTVTVPGSALYSPDPILITVTAASNWGSASDATDIEVHVKQYYGISASMESSSASVKVGEGRDAVTKVTVTNEGNGPDTFRISVSGDIVPFLTPSSPKVDLQPGDSRDVSFNLLVAEGSKAGKYVGTVIVASTKSTEKQTFEFEITIEAKGSSGPTLPIDWYWLALIVIVVAVIAALGASSSGKKKRQQQAKPRGKGTSKTPAKARPKAGPSAKPKPKPGSTPQKTKGTPD